MTLPHAAPDAGQSSALLRLTTRVLAISNGLNQLCRLLSITALFLLAAVIVGDVILRHFFVIGSTKLQELEWHLHGALFLFALGYALSRNSHVRISLFYDQMTARRRAWVDLLGCFLLLFPYVAALLYFAGDYALISYIYDESSASPTGLENRWIIKGVMVAGFFALGLAALARALSAIAYLRGATGAAIAAYFEDEHPHTGAGT